MLYITERSYHAEYSGFTPVFEEKLPVIVSIEKHYIRDL